MASTNKPVTILREVDLGAGVGQVSFLHWDYDVFTL